MEPWFPLGDWRWLVLGALGFVPWALTYYKEVWSWMKPPPTPPPAIDQEEVLLMMQALLGDLRLGRRYPLDPDAIEQAIRMEDLAEKLWALNLAPWDGYRVEYGERLFQPDRWQDYLASILPYVEEFGVERALEETRKYNDPANRAYHP